MLTSKITDYIVSLMCARRSERTEKIAESVLSHICDITGEKCNLDDPQNDIQRLQVFLAERFAVWLANLLVNADEVLCEELTKHKVKVERKSEELRRWSSLKPERPSASELKKQRELEKEKRKEEKRQKKLEEEEKRREEERQKKLEEEERQKSLEEEERQKSLEEEEKQKEEGNQNKLKEDEEGKEKREEEEKLEEEEGMNKEEESKQELEEEESRKKEEMERSSEPEKEKPLDETLESQEEEDQDKKSSDLEKADEDEIKATENEKIEAEDILDEVEKESEEGKTGDQEEVVDEIIVGEGEITGEVSREEMVEEELKESERDEEITVGGEEKVAEEESVGEEEGETSDEGLLEDYALEKSEEDHIPAEEEGGDHPSDSEGLKDEEEEIKPEIETAEPLSIVEEWIEETTPVESDQQKAISELLEKEVVKSMGDVTPEEAEAMKEVIKKTSSLVDQLTTEAKGQLEGQTMEILPSPPLPFPKQRQTTIYLIKKDAEGCFYKVQQIEQKKVCDLTKVARTRRVGLMPESICKRPKNEKPLKNFTELKDWAKWAADVVNFAEKWASWISNTSMEAKKRIEDQEIKTNWVKFKGKAEMHAIELLRNKKYVKQTSKAWKEKLSKIN